MATIRHLVIDQNADFEDIIIVKDKVTKLPLDLTGYTARMMAKSLDGITTLFDITPTVGTTDGRVTIRIPESSTQNFTWRQGRYDLKIEHAGQGKSIRVMQGYVSVSPGVTPA